MKQRREVSPTPFQFHTARSSHFSAEYQTHDTNSQDRVTGVFSFLRFEAVDVYKGAVKNPVFYSPFRMPPDGGITFLRMCFR